MKNVLRTIALCAVTVVILTVVISCRPPALGGEIPLDKRDAELPKLQMPDEFALVFSFGYVQDHMPKDPKVFEFLLQNLSRVGINTIHCKYTPWRLKLCEKYNVKMMIDLAVPEHDLKQSKLCTAEETKAADNLEGAAERFNKVKAELDKAVADLRALTASLDKAPDEAAKATLRKRQAELEAQKTALDKQRAALIGANVKAICEQVKGSHGVWGYGLWYDNGTSGSFLNHAVEKLRLWDPTHVTFVGSYRHGGLETVTINPGCYGWYDFHWQRGTLWHYLDMRVALDICRRRGAVPGCYPQYSGLKQDLFTVNQCIASGVKMTIWFIGGPFGREDHKWYEDQELVQIAAEVRHMYKELMLIGLPTNVYSTPVTRSHDNKPLPEPAAIPRWFTGFPKDFWAQVSSGEAMLGFFKYKDGTDAIYVANHNAFAAQDMTLRFNVEAKLAVKMFDRKSARWETLELKDNSVSFRLGEGGGELLRISGRAGK